MKVQKLLLALLAFALFACDKQEIDSFESVQQMKEVTLKTDMECPDTKASIDTETGAFTWQSGDLISVLATDGNFYDFILSSGAGERTAEFTGSIPETAEVTTVATYPRIAENGTSSANILNGSTLNYNLPSIWTYAKDVSNVPMVASFGEGAGLMSFKQVGGIMRFHIENLPTECEVEVTMADKTVTGPFAVDITKLGESCMVVGEGKSSVVLKYKSDIDGASADFNLPLPTGVYNNFTLVVRDSKSNILFTKDYEADNTINRATLLNMSEIVLPDRPMVISEVWPFFVDARVVFSKYEGFTDYAFYIDGAETPVILTAEELSNGKLGGLIGGDFEHNSVHSVAVAKVIDGDVIDDSRSETVEFTTGRIMQMTRNTGTRFVCAGWDDVAIGKENSTVYDEATKKWSCVPVNHDIHDGSMRGYRVQLYAEDKSTLLYDEVPFNGQADYGAPFRNSSWLGKIGGANILIPTSLSFGWLEPGKKYYVRVQTLAEPVIFDSPETGSFDTSGERYTVTSTRGGSAWSDFVELTTDAAHVPGDNEVLYEGFDDMFYGNDYMNFSPAIVPEVLTSPTTENNYIKKRTTADLYKAWVAKPFDQREFSAQAFASPINMYYLGLCDDKYTNADTPRYFNDYAGSLEGWAMKGGGNENRSIYPLFGAVRIGQSANATGYMQLHTAPLQSTLLSADKDTRCRVTVKVSYMTTDKPNPVEMIGFHHLRDGYVLDNTNNAYFAREADGVTYKSDWTQNRLWTNEDNYINYPVWFEVSTEMKLRRGDVIAFEKPNPYVTLPDGSRDNDYYRGFMVLGEVKVETLPAEENTFVDDGVGTEPDDTNYDIYGLGEVPISYWYTVEPSSYIDYDANGNAIGYNYEKTKARYQEVKDAGINIALYYGHSIDRSITENKRIHDICEEVGLKFIGAVNAPDNATRISLIKENFANSDTYVGELLYDEPSALRYDELGQFAKAFYQEIPHKEVYVNLFPSYARAADQLRAASYEDYIDQYIEKVATKSLSYDFYGLGASGSLNAQYFSNLDLVRNKTLNEKMPFWVITQAGQAPSCRLPNEVEQRWTVWSNLAVGSKGIAYFCYWTPSGHDYAATPFMIDLNGNKTDMYHYTAKINKDINTVGKVLLHCHADGAIMTGTTYYPLFDNGGAGRTKYGPIQKVTGNHNILCGCFRDARKSMNGENFKGYKALVMSQMPNRDVEAYLAMSNTVNTIKVTHIHTTTEITLTNDLNTTVGRVGVKFDGATLTLSIPSGEAALLEF